MEDFLPLNIERIATRLGIEQKGKERGSAKLPPPDSKLPDDIELSISGEVGNFARQAHSALANHLRALRERASAILAADSTDRIRGMAQDTTTSMFAQVRTGTGVLFNAKRDLIHADRDLEDFMNKNSLARPASYPSSHFFLSSLLALLLVLESVFNAFLLGDASEFGILGGFADMIAISVINLAFGFSIGKLILPQFSYNSQRRRFFFLVILGFAGAAIFAFNLFVGHYRDIISITASDLSIVDYGARAVNRLLEDPFGLQDFKSWVFTLIGLIFSSVAIVDGYKWDDPHPGYGARDRQHKRLVNNYGQNFERLQLLIEERAIGGKGDIDQVADTAGLHQQELLTIQSRAKGLCEKLNSYYAQLEKDGQLLTQKYRQVNLGARGDAPAPEHFNIPFSVPESDRTIPSVDIDGAIDVDELRRVASHARKLIEKAHRGLLDVYKTIDQLTKEDIDSASVSDFTGKIVDLEGAVNVTDNWVETKNEIVETEDS